MIFAPCFKVLMDGNKPVFITGSAGFIGFHLALKLLESGRFVVGLDSLNDYYNVGLKKDRLALLDCYPGFTFRHCDLTDNRAVEEIFKENSFDIVVHLAAQAGVRYSLANPRAYIESNINGFFNVLEACRQNGVKHFVFASSSSVYGANEKVPFSEHDNVDHPVSLYAATKKADELIAHSYSHLFKLPSTGLRFFTVYGPWGRPDMALFLFTRAILSGEPIKVFNGGNLSRDFTYIDDIVECMLRIIEKAPEENPAWNGLMPDPASSFAPYRIYNIGNNRQVRLLDFISLLEDCLKMEAKKEFLPMQPGDVLQTFANIDDLAKDFDYRPRVSLREGILSFVDWYKKYYGISPAR